MSSIVVAGDVSGSVTLSAPSAAGSVVVTLPSASGTMAVTGGSPSFATLTVTGDASISGLTVGKGLAGGSSNTALGYTSLSATTSGVENTGVGSGALQSVTSGSSNTAVGRLPLLVNTTGGQNTAIGTEALRNNTTASNNTAVGYQNLLSNTTGTGLTSVGYTALGLNTTGSYNTAMGNGALYANTTGTRNVAFGYGSLAANTTASYNTAYGMSSLIANTTGASNTAIGNAAGVSNTTGYENVFIGANAGNVVTTGARNTIVGNVAGSSLTTGSNNTFVGANGTAGGCGEAITTGSKNTILGGFTGYQTGLDIRTLSNWVVLSDGDGNPKAGVNSGNWFWANQGGTSSPYYNSTQHRFSSAVSQGTPTFTISSYPTANNDSIIVSAVSGGNANAAGNALWVSANNSTARSINAAGTINAGGSDYAEYMTKSGDFIIAKGDVVGIDANGKLTNVFAESVSFVVKSTDPSYVGGDIWFNEKLSEDATEEQKQQFEADLEAARQLVDRIAFSGQVPVNVLGATPGQYIVPVNDNGAIKGEAVSNPTFEQYQIAVGKVIAIEADGRAKIIVKVA